MTTHPQHPRDTVCTTVHTQALYIGVFPTNPGVLLGTCSQACSDRVHTRIITCSSCALGMRMRIPQTPLCACVHHLWEHPQNTPKTPYKRLYGPYRPVLGLFWACFGGVSGGVRTCRFGVIRGCTHAHRGCACAPPKHPLCTPPQNTPKHPQNRPKTPI